MTNRKEDSVRAPCLNHPVISIAMPVLNCESTVEMAVRSILNQTFCGWELIIIDDGSTDGTLKKLSSFRDSRIAVYQDGQNKGLPVRLNEALGKASGKYFARMDGDDVSYPRRLELQLGYLQSHDEIDLLGGGVLVFGKWGRAIGKRVPPREHSDICSRPYSGFPMVHPTFFGRTEWFRLWMFKPDAGGACDQDLLIRSFGQSRLANVPEILLGYREENVSLRKCTAYRSSFNRSLISYYWNTNRVTLLVALALVVIKSVIDMVAVVTGLQYRILRHRACPASGKEIANWKEVWNSVNV